MIDLSTKAPRPFRTHKPSGILVALIFVFSSLPAKATEHGPGVWAVLSSSDAIPSESGRWSYAFDAQLRYFDVGSGSNQALVRPSVGYKVHDNLQVWLGYGRFRTRNAAGATSNENRLFQQANWVVGNYKGGTLSMRGRFLQRELSTGDDLGLVVRLMAKYVRPIGGDRSKDFIVSVEPFIDLRDTDWGGEARISQNRVYIGVGWRVGPKLALETGYMNQFFWRENRENLANHLFVTNFKVKF